MRFLYPQYFKLFILLAVILPLWFYYLWTKYKTRLNLGVSQPLRKISHLSSVRKEFIRYILLNLVLCSLIFALAHPQWIREKGVVQLKKMDIVFLLDTSPSMRAADIAPSRLERAMEVIGSFSHKKPPYDRIGLVSFSSGSLILSYLTEDPSNILYYLNYLRDETTVSLGTNIGQGLENGLAIFTKELEVNPGAVYHKRVFILVSDGEDHGRELESAVERVKSLGIKVHTIGIGSNGGAPIPIAWENGRVSYLEDEEGNRILSRFDEGILRWIAQETGGNAYRSFTGEELEGKFAEIALKEREIEGFKKITVYKDAYQEFLLVALGFFLTSMLL